MKKDDELLLRLAERSRLPEAPVPVVGGYLGAYALEPAAEKPAWFGSWDL